MLVQSLAVVVVVVVVGGLVPESSATTCDCDYHSGGCVISKPAEKNFKCKCLYKGFWTCAGVAFACSSGENCPGGRADYCACTMVSDSDCGAYSDADRAQDCSAANRAAPDVAVSTAKAECDCDYHTNGCILSKPAPSNYKCVCVYKGAWTCSGWAKACNTGEYCPGGLLTYCACKQGEGDCGAYPEASTDPNGAACDHNKGETCDCNDVRQWTEGQYNVTKVEYDLNQGKVQTSTPEVVGTKIIPNHSGSTQTITFSATETVETSSSYSHTEGVSISVGTEFAVGIPLVSEGSVTTSVSASTEHTWGKTETKSESFSKTYACNGTPHAETTCKIMVQKGTVEVPYSMTLVHKRLPDCSCVSKGVWNGVQSFNLRLDVTEKKYEGETR